MPTFTSFYRLLMQANKDEPKKCGNCETCTCKPKAFSWEDYCKQNPSAIECRIYEV